MNKTQVIFGHSVEQTHSVLWDETENDPMLAWESNKTQSWCKIITSLTKHIPDVSVPGQRSEFILSPSVKFIVVPGKLHHLQTQNTQVKIWEVTSNNTFSVQILALNMILGCNCIQSWSIMNQKKMGFYALDDDTSGEAKHG